MYEITHLLQIDNRLPEPPLHLMKVPHSDLSEVSRMVFIEIRAVMVLPSCHTSSTGMFAMLAYAAMTGGDVAAAV